ncbi:unnamed protein product [Camellia sinensis]
MAARRGESEGINLISSTYSDDDDEMEDMEHQEPPNDDANDNMDLNNEDDSKNNMSEERVVDSANDDTPPLSNDDSTPKPPTDFRPLTPSLSSPPPQQLVLTELSRTVMHRLTIVDYGHDEVALSPEAEEGEIVGTSVVMISSQLQTTNVDVHEKTPPGTALVVTSSSQAATTQLSEQLDASESHTMNYAVNESETTVIDETVTVSVEFHKDVDPLDRFLPLPPKAKCSDELQEKINKFLYLKRLGKSYNAEVRNKKEYRNPNFLLHAVTYQDIDQIGSCFSKDVFDPHGYDKSDYYDEIGNKDVGKQRRKDLAKGRWTEDREPLILHLDSESVVQLCDGGWNSCSQKLL